AMLDELDQAAEIEEDIVVTLWTPFEASVGLDMRALEDPDNIYGDPESVHTLGRNGFTEDFPDVTSMIDNLSLTSQEMAELEHVIVNEPDRDAQADAVQTWIDNQPEILEQMSAGLQSHCTRVVSSSMCCKCCCDGSWRSVLSFERVGS